MNARWGDPAATEAPPKVQLVDVVNTALPAIELVAEQLSDPVRRAAVLEAKLANARASGATASRIRVLEAKLTAARQAAGLRAESTESTRDWRVLGKTGAAVGIGVGVALILLLISRVR